MAREHFLKTWPGPYEAVAEGRKRFELRVDDRGFEEGDTLVLREYDPTPLYAGARKAYTGRAVRARVSYLLRGAFGLPPGLVVMSLADVRRAPVDSCGLPLDEPTPMKSKPEGP